MVCHRPRPSLTPLSLYLSLSSAGNDTAAATGEDSEGGGGVLGKTIGATKTVTGALGGDTTTTTTASDANETDSSGSNEGGGGVLDKTRTATTVATTVATGALVGGGDTPSTPDNATESPNSSFAGLTEPIPEGYGCYNKTNLLCTCGSDQSQDACQGEGLIWSQDCAWVAGGASKRELYTNFEPSAVPGGIDSETGDEVPA